MSERLPEDHPTIQEEPAGGEVAAAVAQQASTKQVFVAYSYKTYPKADYRRVFTDLEKTYDVRFIFADEKITNIHILQKIISYIRGSDFSLFDISGWNPNVTLELGFAMATGDAWYICIDPTKTDVNDVPADLRGIDRVEYGSYEELRNKLSALLEQRYPKRKAESIEVYLNERRKQLLEVLAQKAGLTIQGIAQILGLEVVVAQLVVQPLIGREVETTGKTRGMKYYLKGQVPKR